MAEANDKLKELYNALSPTYNLGTYEEFSTKMSDEKKRRAFYDGVSKKYNLGTYDEFTAKIGSASATTSGTPQPAQQASSRVKPITDNTATSASVAATQQSAQPSQSTGWKPSLVQRMALDMQMEQANSKLKQQVEESRQRLGNIQKGNRSGAFMGEREINPQTGQTEKVYYTTQGGRVGTQMEQSRRNTDYHTWWENNTEAGQRSKEQRLQREFDARLGSLWSRHNPTEGENAAEKAWSAAEARQQKAQNANAKRNWDSYAAMGGGREMRIVTSSMTHHENAVDHLTNFDLDRLMNDSWNNLGEKGQQALIDDCHKILRYRFPGADDLALYKQAQELARQQSDLRLYELAVEKNRPKSEIEYLLRKVGDMNVILNISRGLAVSRAKSKGDMSAYEAANEEYRQDGHKVLDVAGSVTGIALDPTTWLSGVLGGAAAKSAMWLGGRFLAGRGATAAITNAATRQFTTSMTGRVIGGIVGGSVNFGTFEGLKEMESQFAHGGHIVGQDDRGRYISEGYSPSAVGKQTLHGLGMGAAIGWISPVSGNVSDKLVRSTSTTAGKIAGRTGLYAGATTLEGTIFSVPEWISGERDAMDVWTDNMAMMAGFKAQHVIKTAGGVLGDLKASFDSPTNGRKNRLDFESRLRMRLDTPSDGGLALTKDERGELERLSYSDLRELVESAEATGKASEGSLITKNASEIVSRLTDMVQDSRLSEAARAKMYFYATGRKLPESTIMRGEMVEDGNGGFIVESQGANGVITSRTFKNRKAADLELERINRQVELNRLELGERYQQTLDFENRLQDACRTVAAKNGWDTVEVYRMCEEARRNHLKGVDKELDEAQQSILRKVTEAMGEFDETGITDEIRGRINEQYGVDIDQAIRKDANRRTAAEQAAIDDYLAELIPEKAKEHNPVDDVEAEDITNQEQPTDAGESRVETDEEPIEPRSDNGEPIDAEPQEPNGEQRPVGRAVMKYQDREVEVLNGRVVMTEDGTMVDKERSDNTIVIRDVATGKVEMVAPDAILRYEDYPAEQPVEEMAVEPQTEAPAEEVPATEQPKYGVGQITIRNSDGTETRGWLTGTIVTEDNYDDLGCRREDIGKYEYYVEGDLQRLHYSTEHDLDNFADYKPDAPAETPAEKPAEKPADASAETPADASGEAPTGASAENIPSEGNNAAENIQTDNEDYQRGYTYGMQKVENYSNEKLDEEIDKLDTEAESMTVFGKGLYDAMRYERERRNETQPTEAPREGKTPPWVTPVGEVEIAQRDGTTRRFTLGKDEEGENVVVDDRGYLWGHDGNGGSMKPYRPGENVPTWSDEQIAALYKSNKSNKSNEPQPLNPDTSNLNPPSSPLQRIPYNEKGEPVLEQAESPEHGWDALVEYRKGDAKKARGIAEGMVKLAKEAHDKAQKLKPKGRNVVELSESQDQIEAEQAQAAANYEFWQKVAAVEQSRQEAIRKEEEAETQRQLAERAEQEKAERQSREEAARIEREALEGIPEWHRDTPEAARARGSRRFSGALYTRQEPVEGVSGKEIEVKFSQSDLPKGRVAVIEASQLQPSHIQGERNPMFFIEEAQPKNRSEAVSTLAAQQIAESIRPEEITGSATAYTGAPTVNARGEVIQGNNRSDALRYLWENKLPKQQATYKQYLMDNAEAFGLDREAVNAMQQPVLVNMLDVDDAEAIRLGQMTAQDTESGGIERIKPKNVAQKLGDNMRTFANLLLRSGDEDASFGQLVDANGMEVMKWMNQVGAISNTQYQSAFDSKGNLTAEAKNDLQKVLYQAVFKGGSQQLEEMFDKLPAKAQRAILATAFRDMDSPFAGKLLPEIQASIAAYDQLMSDPQFKEAKNMEGALRAVQAFKQTIALDDRFEQYMPADNFSNFALHLAAMYKAGDMSQSTIASYFNQMYDLAQGKKAATLFEEADTTQYPLADVIQKVLNIEYQPAKNGNNDVRNGGADVALRNQDGQGGELRSDEPPAGREQTEGGTEPTERGGGTSDDSARSGRRGNIRPADERKDNLQPSETEELDYQLSDEVDENGRQFVLNSRGEIEFGRIEASTGLAEAPILLSEGIITNPRTKEGYGLIHIEAKHGSQIRSNGYKSVVEFIEQVAKNWSIIKEGKDRNGNQTYRLIAIDSHHNTLMVELSGDGSYWNINTAGIFKSSYGKNNREIYNRHTTVNQSTETDGESQGTEQSGTTEPSRMSTPKSEGKGNTLLSDKQGVGGESFEGEKIEKEDKSDKSNKSDKTDKGESKSEAAVENSESRDDNSESESKHEVRDDEKKAIIGEGYTIEARKDTRDNSDLYAVKFEERVGKEEFGSLTVKFR